MLVQQVAQAQQDEQEQQAARQQQVEVVQATLGHVVMLLLPLMDEPDLKVHNMVRSFVRAKFDRNSGSYKNKVLLSCQSGECLFVFTTMCNSV